VILAAIAQPPDDRPATADALRGLLFDEEAPQPTPIPVSSTARGVWQDLIGSHAALVVTVILLTVTALLVTLLAPPLP
jgi:hypothetical protein